MKEEIKLSTIVDNIEFAKNNYEVKDGKEYELLYAVQYKDTDDKQYVKIKEVKTENYDYTKDLEAKYIFIDNKEIIDYLQNKKTITMYENKIN